MKKILLPLAIGSILCFTACENQDKSSKSEMTISTTINQDSGQAIRKEVFAIKENINGKTIDLKAENGAINSLTIDGQLIAKEDYKKYEDLTASILKKLPAPPAPPAPNAAPPAPPAPPVAGEGSGDEIGKSLENALKKDGFITDGKVKYEFDLSNDALIINGKTVSKEMKDRYLKLFKEQTGKELGTKFHIKFQEDRK